MLSKGQTRTMSKVQNFQFLSTPLRCWKVRDKSQTRVISPAFGDLRHNLKFETPRPFLEREGGSLRGTVPGARRTYHHTRDPIQPRNARALYSTGVYCTVLPRLTLVTMYDRASWELINHKHFLDSFQTHFPVFSKRSLCPLSKDPLWYPIQMSLI